MLARFSLVCFALCVLGLVALPASSQDFRIDTEVFIGEEKAPAAETLTIFTGGLVYDFLLTEPQEITIFDPQRGRFTLLNPARKWKTGVSTQAVLDFATDFAAAAAQSKDTLFAFAATPTFETSVEEYQENGQSLTKLTLAGEPLAYLAVARHPDKPETLTAYRQFADWYARLNCTRSGNLPPGARLELNKALAERQLLPLEITRTITPDRPLASKIEVRARHLVNWTLSGEDRKRIDRAGDYQASFQSIDFNQYRTTPPVEPKAVTAKR